MMAASKTEEYYPPKFTEFLSSMRMNFSASQIPQLKEVDYELCIEYECKLLYLLNFYVMNPPLFDLGNIVLNELNLESFSSQPLLRNVIMTMLEIPQIFSFSMPAIIAAAIEATGTTDKENLAYSLSLAFDQTTKPKIRSSSRTGKNLETPTGTF